MDAAGKLSIPSSRSLQENNKYLRAYGPHAFGWKMQDLNARGVTGDATLATAEKGEALLEVALQGLRNPGRGNAPI